MSKKTRHPPNDDLDAFVAEREVASPGFKERVDAALAKVRARRIERRIAQELETAKSLRESLHQLMTAKDDLELRLAYRRLRRRLGLMSVT